MSDGQQPATGKRAAAKPVAKKRTTGRRGARSSASQSSASQSSAPQSSASQSSVPQSSAPQSSVQQPSSRRSARARAAAMPASLVLGAALLSGVTVALAGLAAAPIYLTTQLWWVVAVAGVVGFCTVWAGRRWKWGGLTFVALSASFVALVGPLAVPSAMSGGLRGVLRGIGDGLAAVALGWKQLLTLTLPLGSYQTVLVPLLVVTLVAVATVTALALRGGRVAPFAAIPALLPVLFGTVFGASSVSSTVTVGPLTVTAPRELALWLAAFCVGAIWVAWSAGLMRRAALRLGREPMANTPPNTRPGTASVRRNMVLRGLVGMVLVGGALFAGLALVPVLDSGSRSVARDAIDPELVVRQQTSPLAGYRVWKRDALFGESIFTVSSSAALPSRLRIAVLDHYNGVDFSVGDVADSGRFTRFPSGQTLAKSSRVQVTIEDGYQGFWVPVAPPLAGPPNFGGGRADTLADSFYMNRELGSAVALPTVTGLKSGDSYAVDMTVSGDAKLGADPANAGPLIDLESMPELERWLGVQKLPSNMEGLSDAIKRLRDRGYLSHSLTNDEGEREWSSALAKEYGTKFVTSPGGHSIARVEQLFQQLNEQESTAGEHAKESALVAGIGDDEQFATAAALLARAMGFESRVVLGVRLGDEGEDIPGIPACQATCTGENITAWVEARGSDGVWAPFDVTPQAETPPTALEEGELLPEFPTVPEERDATESDPPVGTSDSESSESENDETDRLSELWPILRVVGLSAATLLLVALPLLFIPLVKRARSRRRRGAAVAEVYALGAWEDLIAAYVDTGMKLSGGGTRREVAEVLAIEAGDWVLWTLDRAVYAPEGIDPEVAEQLWRVVDDVIAARLAGLGLWARVRARYSLASFGVGVRGARGSGARNSSRVGVPTSAQPVTLHKKQNPASSRVDSMEMQP